MSRHEHIDTSSAEPVNVTALGSGAAAPSAPAGAPEGTVRGIAPENDPRMRAYLDG